VVKGKRGCEGVDGGNTEVEGSTSVLGIKTSIVMGNVQIPPLERDEINSTLKAISFFPFPTSFEGTVFGVFTSSKCVCLANLEVFIQLFTLRLQRLYRF
jgi:hypothetical protein